MKKISALFFVFMFVFSSNLIAVPIKFDNVANLTNGPGNAWNQADVAAIMSGGSRLTDRDTFISGFEDNDLKAFIGRHHESVETCGFLVGECSLDRSNLSATRTPAAPVPEPASLLLLGVGMLSAGIFARKKRQK